MKLGEGQGDFKATRVSLPRGRKQSALLPLRARSNAKA
jgi:hypothetical protein